MTNSGRLWGRHANVDSPASGSGPTITAGWHTLVRVWDGQQVRQYVDGLRTNTVAVTATGSWTIYKWGFCNRAADVNTSRSALPPHRGALASVRGRHPVLGAAT